MGLLILNSVGPDVACVQQALNLLMFPPYVTEREKIPKDKLAVDRIYGKLTRQRVIEFQRLRGIKDDGIVGPITKWHLFPFVHHRGRAQGRPKLPITVQRYQPGPYATAALHGTLLAQTVGDRFRPAPNLFPPPPPLPLPRPQPAPGDGDSFLQNVSVDLLAGQKLQLAPLPPLGSDDARIRSLFFEWSFTVVRHEHWELSLNLELSRKVPGRPHDRWEVDGSAQLSVTSLPRAGPLKITPFMEAIPHKLGGAAGLEACLEVDRAFGRKGDSMVGVCVGGKGAVGLSTESERMKFEASGEVEGGVKVDVLRVLETLF